jgi:hypothetical protein
MKSFNCGHTPGFLMLSDLALADVSAEWEEAM